MARGKTIATATLLRSGREWRIPIVAGKTCPVLMDSLLEGDTVRIPYVAFLDVCVPFGRDEDFWSKTYHATEWVRVEGLVACVSCGLSAAHDLTFWGELKRQCECGCAFPAVVKFTMSKSWGLAV